MAFRKVASLVPILSELARVPAARVLVFCALSPRNSAAGPRDPPNGWGWPRTSPPGGEETHAENGATVLSWSVGVWRSIFCAVGPKTRHRKLYITAHRRRISLNSAARMCWAPETGGLPPKEVDDSPV